MPTMFERSRWNRRRGPGSVTGGMAPGGDNLWQPQTPAAMPGPSAAAPWAPPSAGGMDRQPQGGAVTGGYGGWTPPAGAMPWGTGSDRLPMGGGPAGGGVASAAGPSAGASPVPDFSNYGVLGGGMGRVTDMGGGLSQPQMGGGAASGSVLGGYADGGPASGGYGGPSAGGYSGGGGVLPGGMGRITDMGGGGPWQPQGGFAGGGSAAGGPMTSAGGNQAQTEAYWTPERMASAGVLGGGMGRVTDVGAGGGPSQPQGSGSVSQAESDFVATLPEAQRASVQTFLAQGYPFTQAYRLSMR